jgi:SAM-dependent methyltransferase
MQDITISDLEIMNEAQNYRTWIYNHIKPFLGSRILEIGAGIGNLTEFLCHKECVVGIDVHPECINYLNNRFKSYDNFNFFQYDIAKVDILELTRYKFDTVICINVLEHVGEDLVALKNIYDLLSPNGVAIILVPAFNFLFGTVDKSLKHYRRYSRKQLIRLVAQTKFHDLNTFYINFIGILGWFLNNKILRRKEESKKQIIFFDQNILPWMSKIEERIHFPFGLSLITVCRK